MMVDHNAQLSLVGRWSLVIRPLDYRRRFVPMSISRGAIAGSTVGDTMNGMSNQTVDALPRVLFFGMTGSFSRTVLATLLAAQVPICGYILPTAPQADPPLQRVEPMQTMGADDGELIILNPVRTQNSIQLAWQHNIPIFEVGNLRAPAVQNFVAKLAPDVACVACFAQRIPPALLTMPRHGFLNVHPSRLPAYRGPAPLFWQWRNGETQTGVTVHWMDERLDTGAIAVQAPITLPDGSSGPQADQICARVGGELLVNVLQALGRGEVPRQPQPAGGSYQPWPQAADFSLDSTWSAQRAFNFMRGTAEWGHSYSITIDNQQLALAEAVAYMPNESLGCSLLRGEEGLYIQFDPGVLHAYEG